MISWLWRMTAVSMAGLAVGAWSTGASAARPAAVVMALAAESSAPAGPVVHAAVGALRGRREGDVDVFRAIPYAAPPIGSLRWRAPQPVDAWRGLRDAGAFGPICPQVPLGNLIGRPQSEDCLSLNIWRPHGHFAKPLPVMLWIHGGGSNFGAGSDPAFDGTRLARRGVVLVSINYRLGRLGYFAHPALTAADADHGLLGNYGLMDQLAAMRWVRANIASFGGDPANVTIFGESAGGCYVDIWMTSPAARGLFAKAITQSCPGYIESEPLHGDGEARGLRLAQEWGVSGNDPAALTALRALPASALLSRSAAKSAYPFLDGAIVREDPFRAIAAGRIARRPWMIGSNSFDASYMPFYGVDLSQPLAAYPATDQQHLLAAYAAAGDTDPVRAGLHVLTDVAMAVTDRTFARQGSAAGTPVHVYTFRYEAQADRGRVPGVVHGGELRYIFDAPIDLAKISAAEDQAEAARIEDAWVGFAKIGNPGWPAFTVRTPITGVFTPGGDLEPRLDFRKVQLDAATPYAIRATSRWDP